MAKIALEKYVDTCVKALQEKISESVIIEYTNTLATNKDAYNDLATRVVYDVCRHSYKVFEVLSDEDYQNSNDNKIKSLHFKAFQTAFPLAWNNIQAKK